MIKILFGIALILHGMVHLLYAGQSMGKFELTPGLVWPENSWLFTKLLRLKDIKLLAAVFLVIAAVGFAAAGLGSIQDWLWWQLAATGSAAFSAFIFLLFLDGRFHGLSDQGGFGVLINMVIIVVQEVFR